MSKELNPIQPIQIADAIRQKFSVFPPLFLVNDADSIKLEMKPYLQPFERELAMRELRSLLDDGCHIREEYGYHLVRTDKPEEFFRLRLTYWQRVGRALLEPTVQKSLEFTQNGLSNTHEKRELHNARRLRYGPHDLHEYRGKFFPQLVRSLVNISGVRENALVLDPMCGSGTTPCEALASGRSAIGADLNPLSVLIATVKSAVVLENHKIFFETVSGYIEKFRFKAFSPENIWSQDDLSYLKRWFDPKAIRDLSAVLAEIKKIRKPLYRDFFRVCLSNVIRSVSWQKDTDLRVRKEVRPYDSGTAISLFKEEALEQLDRIYPYLCVLPQSSVHPTLTIRRGNAVKIAEMFPEYQGKVDILVTSPPYATALPYLDTDRLSLIVLGLLPRNQHQDIEMMMVGTREVSERQRRETWDLYLARKNELPERISELIDQIAEHNHGDNVGFRRRNLPALLGRYYLNMLDAMHSARTLMTPNAHGYYVVGNNSTVVDGQKIEIPTNEFLFDIGAAAGWHQEEMIPMELLVSRDIFKVNRGSAETILCFRA
jgi:site-specific DNA-methyltransferase (cytosine-N4-specific)